MQHPSLPLHDLRGGGGGRRPEGVGSRHRWEEPCPANPCRVGAALAAAHLATQVAREGDDRKGRPYAKVVRSRCTQATPSTTCVVGVVAEGRRGAAHRRRTCEKPSKKPKNFLTKQPIRSILMKLFETAPTKNAAIAQSVERILGKDEVASSNLASSSICCYSSAGRAHPW